MRRIFYTLAGVMLLLWPLMARANVGMLEGTVTDAKDNKPIVGAQVQVKMGKGNVLTTKTNDKGQYLFATVPAGKDYKLKVKKENYEEWKGNCPEILAGKTSKKNVSLNKAAKTGSLQGVILAGGQPLSGVTVKLGREKTKSGGDGAYALEMPPGEYKLVARKDGYKKHEAKVTIEPETIVTLDIELLPQ